MSNVLDFSDCACELVSFALFSMLVVLLNSYNYLMKGFFFFKEMKTAKIPNKMCKVF